MTLCHYVTMSYVDSMSMSFYVILCQIVCNSQVADKTDIFKVEIVALQAICKASGLSSQWWPLQVQLLREAAYVAGAESTLSPVRDRGSGAKLEQYVKALTTLHATMVRSDTMIGEVRTNQGQDWANRMSVAPVLKERYFNSDASHIFHLSVRTAAQTA